MQNVIQWCKTAFFFKKLRKIAKRLGASPPDPYTLRRLGAPPPDTLNDTFELRYTPLLNYTSPNLRHSHSLTIGLSPLLEPVPSYMPTLSHGF